MITEHDVREALDKIYRSRASFSDNDVTEFRLWVLKQIAEGECTNPTHCAQACFGKPAPR